MPHNPSFSPRRVMAIIYRHLYLLRNSWARLFEIIYWPFLNLVIWGFLTKFLMTNSSLIAQATGLLLGAVLLWDVFFRSQLGVSVSMLEEMWSRNLVNLFVSPLRPYEYVISLFSIGLLRVIVGVLPAMLMAIPFYDYSIFTLGFPLMLFFINLMVMGWWLGLVICGLLLRAGLGAENLAWTMIFIISPIAGVYYPIATLPDFLQAIAWCLPTAHIFEGMRGVMLHGVMDWNHMAKAIGLNILGMIGAGYFFLQMMNRARRDGQLLHASE